MQIQNRLQTFFLACLFLAGLLIATSVNGNTSKPIPPPAGPHQREALPRWTQADTDSSQIEHDVADIQSINDHPIVSQQVTDRTHWDIYIKQPNIDYPSGKYTRLTTNPSSEIHPSLTAGLPLAV